MPGPLKRIWRSIFPSLPETPAKRKSDGTQWCLVGHIVEVRKYGQGGEETRRGTKHFAPGTKVYCLPARWGDGYEQIIAIGRHRGSTRFRTMVISSAWVTDWRAKVVYSPEVLRRINCATDKRGRGNWTTKEHVEEYVAFLKEREAERRAT